MRDALSSANGGSGRQGVHGGVSGSVYHAAPLHYLPSIFESESLLSAQVSRPRGILPRRTACRRDRMLGLDRYIHFGFDRFSPLLLDKLARGMAHAVLRFDLDEMLRETSPRCAIVPYNAKAWRTRSCYAPIHDRDEMTALLRRREEFGRYKSAEFLVEGSVSLDSLREITVFAARDEELMVGLLRGLYPGFAHKVQAYRAPEYRQDDIDATEFYFAECVRAGQALAPPPIEFD